MGDIAEIIGRLECRVGLHDWEYAGHEMIGSDAPPTVTPTLIIHHGWRQIHYRVCTRCKKSAQFHPPTFYYRALRQIAEERGMRKSYIPALKSREKQ